MFRHLSFVGIVGVGLLLSLSFVRSASAKVKTVRVALLVGHNSGGPRLPTLRYAQKDVARMAKVLRELGGYSKQHIHILQAPTVQRVRQKMKEIRAGLKRQRASGIFFFYYSGHSVANAFLLGREQLSHHDVLRFVRTLPVSLRFVIIDSCYSGSLLRFKGNQVEAKGMRRKKDMHWIPRHFAMTHKGEVVLTSSGRLSRSYESSSLQSSLFTASLLAGLRGAADTSNDLIVTLGELRTYVYKQTVAYSSKYKVPLQRPHYLVKLKGHGPLQLTFLRRAEGHVLFTGNVQGDVILSRAGSLLEYKKRRGRPLRIGVKAGNYRIYMQDKGWYATRALHVKRSEVKLVSRVTWQQLPINKQIKGGAYTHTFRVALLASYVPISQLAVHGAGLTLSLDLRRWFRLGVQYQFAALNLEERPYLTHELGIPLAFGYGFGFSIFAAWLGVFVEPRLSIRTSVNVSGTFLNLGSLFGAIASFDIHFTPSTVLRLSVSGGAQVLFFDSVSLFSPAMNVSLGFAWRAE